MNFMEEESTTLDAQYDQALVKVQQLNELLLKLANKDTL